RDEPAGIVLTGVAQLDAQRALALLFRLGGDGRPQEVAAARRLNREVADVLVLEPTPGDQMEGRGGSPVRRQIDSAAASTPAARGDGNGDDPGRRDLADDRVEPL